MPGIITHLAFAEKYSGQNPIGNFSQFVSGSIFPDVRYCANVARELTHKKFTPDLDFSGLNSFEAGWKSHIYLDECWNELMKNSVFYGSYKDEPFVASAAVKVLEDGLVYRRLEKPEKYKEIFRNLQLGNILGIPADKIQLYYSAGADYLTAGDFRVFARHFLDEELITKITEKVEEMKLNKVLVNFLSTVLEKL